MYRYSVRNKLLLLLLLFGHINFMLFPIGFTTLFQRHFTAAPWLSWLKRLSSKQEIPSSNLGGASFPTVHPNNISLPLHSRGGGFGRSGDRRGKIIFLSLHLTYSAGWLTYIWVFLIQNWLILLVLVWYKRKNSRLRFRPMASSRSFDWGGGGGGRIHRHPDPPTPKILFLLGFRPPYFENVGKYKF